MINRLKALHPSSLDSKSPMMATRAEEHGSVVQSTTELLLSSPGRFVSSDL